MTKGRELTAQNQSDGIVFAERHIYMVEIKS
jgi:hypothetical protein